MKVLVSNNTQLMRYVDCGGRGKADDTVVIGPLAKRIPLTIPNSSILTALERKFAGELIFNRVI